LRKRGTIEWQNLLADLLRRILWRGMREDMGMMLLKRGLAILPTRKECGEGELPEQQVLLGDLAQGASLLNGSLFY